MTTFLNQNKPEAYLDGPSTNPVEPPANVLPIDPPVDVVTEPPKDAFIPPAPVKPTNTPPGTGTPASSYEAPNPSDFLQTENAQGSGFEPNITPWDVTPDQTVQGQMENFLSQDNPLFDIARQSARRSMGASGAQNTALAEAMGDLSVMNFAFQVSSRDAATFARSAEFNAAMANQFEAAEQQFVQNALLSDQNFRQALTLQSEQIKGQLAGIELSGQWNLKGIETAAQYQNWNAQNQFEREWQIFQNQQRSNYVGMMMDNWTRWSIEQGGLTPEQYSAANAEFFKVYRGGLDLINSFSSVPANPSEGYWGGDYLRWGGG